jgi:signal-transduction protein with cAMP-binding, CBS, and nucleotidyltransferase domain
MVKLVRDVMSRGLVSCTPDATVRQVAVRLHEHGVNALVVVEEASGELEGIVSRSDLARVYDQDYDALTVESVMSHDVETVIPDIPVSAAVLIMLDRGVDRLIIGHAKPAPQRPIGVLSLSDVIRDMAVTA